MGWNGCKASSISINGRGKKTMLRHKKKAEGERGTKPKPNQYRLMDGRDLDLSTEGKC